MFKFVVLCAFLAAATATPGAIVAPLAYSSNILAPATTVISSHPSSVVYSSPYISSSPLAYSAPWGYSHLIKKRSAALAVSSYIAPSSYIASGPLATTYATAPLATTYTAAAPLATTYTAAAPLATTYTAAAPLATTYTAAAPLATTYTHSIYPAAHLIKKRSAPFIVPSSYVAPSYVAPYAAPFLPSTYTAASHYVPAPLVSSAPLFYNTHLIKKRSVLQPVAAYTAPASFSHTSRFDFQTSSPAFTYSSYAGAAP